MHRVLLILFWFLVRLRRTMDDGTPGDGKLPLAITAWKGRTEGGVWGSLFPQHLVSGQNNGAKVS